uniref:DDE-1 domain-containing protein n=1 Tax=Haemonchus contortus TaxID=6289 RepID=A0A7I4Z2I9_HAECO
MRKRVGKSTFPCMQEDDRLHMRDPFVVVMHAPPDSHHLAIVNTRFRKRDSHLINFYSGENRTQLEFVLVRHRDRELVTDAKTVPYETVATQHRPLIYTLKITPPKPKLAERCGPARIEWWRLKDKEAAVVSSILLPAVTTVDETWEGAAEAIARAARAKLDKQTWLWTDHVMDKVREEKKQYHAFLIEKTADNWQRYQIAKKEAKKAVASEKAAHYADLNKELESRDEKLSGINDENGHLTDRRQTLKRWREYFENISTVAFAHPAIHRAPPGHDPVQKLIVNETITTLKKMKSGKATGLDNVAADLRKSKGWNPAGWLMEFFDQDVAEKKMPESWQQSTTIPIWKKKDSPEN